MTNLDLEVQALICEREAMIVTNKQREGAYGILNSGEKEYAAWGPDSFWKMAEKFRSMYDGVLLVRDSRFPERQDGYTGKITTGVFTKEGLQQSE